MSLPKWHSAVYAPAGIIYIFSFFYKSPTEQGFYKSGFFIQNQALIFALASDTRRGERKEQTGTAQVGRRGRMLFPLCFHSRKNKAQMKHKVTKIVIAVLLLTGSTQAMGQKWSIATNILDYADFLTLNAEVGVSVHQHWSVSLKGRYNPFTFPTTLNKTGRIQNRTLSLSAGARYWPFFVYSGWYCGSRLQWSRYNSGGIFSDSSSEGDAFGLGLSAGYALMLTKHLNIEFGLGLWVGGTGFRRYSSPVCGKLTDSGVKAFIAPNDIHINLLYSF